MHTRKLFQRRLVPATDIDSVKRVNRAAARKRGKQLFAEGISAQVLEVKGPVQLAKHTFYLVYGWLHFFATYGQHTAVPAFEHCILPASEGILPYLKNKV